MSIEINKSNESGASIHRIIHLTRELMMNVIRGIFLPRSKRYADRFYQKYSSVLDPKFLGRADFVTGQYVRHLGLSIKDFENKRILDIGAHDGAFLANVASKVKVKDGSVSIDIDEPPIDQASMNFVIANASSLPFADNSFDVVLAHCSVPIMSLRRLKNIEEQYTAAKRIFDEMIRVAKPGATVAVYPVILSHDSLQQKVYDNMKSIPLVYSRLIQEYKELGFDIKVEYVDSNISPDFKEDFARLKIIKPKQEMNNAK